MTFLIDFQFAHFFFSTRISSTRSTIITCIWIWHDIIHIRQILNETRQIAAYDASECVMCIHSISIYLFILSRTALVRKNEPIKMYSSFFGGAFFLLFFSLYVSVLRNQKRKRSNIHSYTHNSVYMLVNKTILFFLNGVCFLPLQKSIGIFFPSLLQIQFNGIQHFSFHNIQ